ncbi:autoinducer [Halalkalibacter urbisdiaboli]|uniref:autoinducer n=1 Tax=Halalkalibacter urbisdiaboli TaxID=1960589 RepID=UPI001FD93E35|nr:autoinducer [Halalkalibacter urbisdiaboli]
MKVILVKLLMVTVIFNFVMGIGIEDVEGKTHEEKQLENFIKGNNYIPLEEAINQYENKQNKKVNVPKKLPFEPSHAFGHIDNEGRLKLHYMRLGKLDKYRTLDFILYIMPESELEKFITSKDKMYTLSNGERAYYRVNPGQWHTLSLTKNEFGYFLGGSDKDNFDMNVLIKIAESIN